MKKINWLAGGMFLGAVIAMIVFHYIVISPLEKQNEFLLRQNPNWEMIKNDCGRDLEKDKLNTYCRAFSDGVDYGLDLKKMDESIKLWQEGLNN